MAQIRTSNPTADMASMLAKARGMRDSELADVLAGKNMSIPQYAAMAEAMGRRDLRQAVEGAEAQQQAKQPSVKDQLLAEQSAPQMVAGIDQLPAANMESMDLAGGGIIAFNGENGSQVEDLEYLKATDPEKYARQKRQSDAWKKVADSGKPYSVEEFRSDVVEPFKGFFTAPWDKAKAEATKKAEISKLMRENNLSAEAAAAMHSVKGIQTQDSPLDYDLYNPNNRSTVKANAAAAAATDPNAPAAAANPNASSGLPYLLAGSKFERRSNPFGTMSAEPTDFNRLKEQGMGEGFMELAAGLLSAPGAKGFSAGLANLAKASGATRKEINALKKDARDYQLNHARASEAFEQGQDELGFKYTQDANTNKYRMAALMQEPGELRTIKAVAANPELASFYKGANKGETLSVKDATTTFNDILEKNPKYARQLSDMGIKDPMAYRQFVITGLPPMQVVDTIPGKGDKVRS